MEKRSPGSRAISARTSEVLPAPDGAEITNRRPRSRPATLLKVLHLLAQSARKVSRANILAWSQGYSREHHGTPCPPRAYGRRADRLFEGCDCAADTTARSRHRRQYPMISR